MRHLGFLLLKNVVSSLISVIFLVPFLVLAQVAFLDSSFAQSSAFTYEGRLFDAAGLPVLDSVSVKFQILNPAGTCVLYEEVQDAVNLATSKGAFSLGVGSAASDTKRSINFRGAYNPSMVSIFRNSATLSSIPLAGCASGTYTAGASDTRLLRVQVTKGSTTETLSPDLVINTVPYSQVAASLQGFLPSDFLRLDVANGISGNIGLTATGTGAGQTREFRFYELAANGAEYSAFKAPDAMATSLTYVLPSAAPAAGDILKATVPASGVVTLSWGADAGAGGGISNLNGSTQSSQSFTAIDIATAITAPAWSTNAGTGAHTLQIPMASGAGVTGGLITKAEHTAFTAKVNRAGDTMTGNLSFSGAAGVAITGTGTIAMGTNKITALGDPSAAQEAATKAYVDSQSTGKISGTLTSGRVPIASGASTVTDSANFTFNSTTGAMGIGGTAPSITSSDAITIAAGGTNQNVVLTPSGTGYTVLNGNVGIGTATAVDPLSIGTAINASATRASVNLSNTALVGGSTNGTYVGANPAAFTGNFIDLQVAGVSRIKADASGNITATGNIIERGPNAFSFTNQTGVNIGATIQSNAVTLAGFTGLLPAACTGCVAIVRNGIPGGTTAAFLPGDTIALQVLSSSSATTAVTASVTIGSTTSSTWSVTTGAATSNTPSAFSFTNLTSVVPNSAIISNTVTLAGFTGTVIATCNAGCSDISINGVWAGATSVAGVFAGNQIRIKQTSSASTSTATTGSVTVGSTTSGTWSVTTSATADPCSGSPAIGTTCLDGTLYAGLTPDGGVKMYTTPCDMGMTWNGTVCTGTRQTRTWNDGSSNWVVVGTTSGNAGQANTATLVALGITPSPAPYQAARYCATTVMNGWGDWYLPAINELNVLYTNRASLTGFDTTGTYYWSSSENNVNTAWVERFSDGNQTFIGKNYTNLVRCIRR